MRIVRHLDKSIWSDFVARHPNGNIFLTPEMAEVYSVAGNHYPDLWAVLDSRDHVLCLFLPVRITLSPFFRSLTTRTVAYGSILYEPTFQGREAVPLLLKSYREEEKSRSLFTELRNLSDLSEIQPVLEEYGFLFKEELNFLIRLDRTEEALLGNIGKRTRKHIRRGLRRSIVKVTLMEDRKALPEWYGLLAKTYRRAGMPLADRSLFEGVFDILVPKKMAAFMLGRVEGQPAVCSLELMYGETVFGWYAGMDRNFSRYNPSELLMWEVLRRSAANGFRVYDFGLAGKPGRKYGVRDFKAKFGGDLVCFGRNICIHKPLPMFLSRAGFSFLLTLKRGLRMVGQNRPGS